MAKIHNGCNNNKLYCFVQSYPIWHHSKLLCFRDTSRLQFSKHHGAHVLYDYKGALWTLFAAIRVFLDDQFFFISFGQY